MGFYTGHPIVCFNLFLALLCQPPSLEAQAADPLLPDLSRYFTGFIESVDIEQGQTVLLRQFYDEDIQFKREDFAFQFRDPNTVGTLSCIEDINLGVRYTINRRFNNCTIDSLYDSDAYTYDPGIVMDPDGRLRLTSLRGYLLFDNDNDFTYKGVETVRGLEVDTWTSVSNFTYTQGAVNFTNTRIEVSFTRPGQSYSSLVSITTDPVLVRFSLQGTVVYEGGSTSNVSFVENFIGGSFDEPSFDVFDISVCSNPSDYRIGTLFISGHVNGLDLGVLRKSIRSTISNYTGLYPIQIGSIEVIGENGTYIFVNIHISNLTSLAQVTNSVSANSAVQMLLANRNNGRLPFEIELSPGNRVKPIFRVHNEDRSCPNLVNGNIDTVTPTCTSTSSTFTLHSVSDGVAVVSTSFTSSVSSSSVHSSSTVAPNSTVRTSSSTVAPNSTSIRNTTHVVTPSCQTPVITPTSSTITVTTTVTTTESICPTTSTGTHSSSCMTVGTTTITVSPSPQPSSPTPCPSSLAQGLTTGPAVGLAFGMFFAGIVFTLIAIVTFLVCRSQSKKEHVDINWKPPPSGYQRQRDETSHKYFQ